MKIHFSRLRRLTLWSSFGAPLLVFVAFLFTVWGWNYWALIPFLLGVLLLGAFPCDSAATDHSKKLDKIIRGWLTVVATFLFLFWIDSIPEWDPFIDQLYSSGAFHDWRLITSFFTWICFWGYTNYRKASTLNDHEIVAFYDEISQSKNQKQNKP